VRLVFLHGTPGVGKLTVGRELARLTGYRLFHNHLAVDLAASVFDFGTPEFIALRGHMWLEVFGRAQRAGLPGLIFTFAAERTVPEAFVDDVVRSVRGGGGEVVFVELTCDAEELRRRVERPERERYGKLRSAELLDRLRREGALFDLAPPGDARAVVVDGTSSSPEQTAAAVLAALENHRPPGTPGTSERPGRDAS
jgi:hypothetical protein